MTEERMRIVTAEICGWKRGIKYDTSFSDPTKQIENSCWERNGIQARKLPDYPNSLDAMHEAEKMLKSDNNHLNPDDGEESDWDSFVWILEQVVGRDCAEEDIYRKCIHATAHQRCEAFLRTFGKWEEAK